MNEDCETTEKKTSAINIKIEMIEGHYIVSFKYKEYMIFHSVAEVLNAIERELNVDDNPYPFTGQEPDRKLTKAEKEGAIVDMTKLRNEHLKTLNNVDTEEKEKK